MSHNLLGRLPQGIENVRNLSILDLSYNKLIYLPAGITNLRLQTIDITMNPLVVISHPKWECELIMPSLTQFAAKALQRYCKERDVIFRLNELNEYINRNTIDNCFYCGNICTTPYVYATRPLQPIFETAEKVIRQTSDMPIVLYEFCYCFPECKENY
ncbi:uncharacterized protein [Mycetomoellerius zeteki]|uniref:uncharacterized protein n=1 Tax=Mycetomoellerius zeteki TaxID=64791 RepID=UPI00084EC394|nr:PREDICTED: uncharacterized protein LOC108729382 [Trachymyrmex zeteki]